jgi:hypothetical protein
VRKILPYKRSRREKRQQRMCPQHTKYTPQRHSLSKIQHYKPSMTRIRLQRTFQHYRKNRLRLHQPRRCP